MAHLRSTVISLLAFTLLVSAGGYTSQSWDQTAVREATASESRSVTGASESPTTYSYEVVNTYPHDRRAFTQGLLFHRGMLYESTGLNGQSSLREVELETGDVQRKVDVPSNYFAEGLALHRGKLYQLTWRSQKGFVYGLHTFRKQHT